MPARIAELFPALEVIERLKPAADDLTGGPDHPTAEREGALGAGALRRLGDYTLLRELGRGGMGIVYEAEHESLKNRVALKVMHPRFRADRSCVRRFQIEARSAAKLHHTNIVPVFDYGEQDGVCFYAMQCIVGIGVDRVLEDVRRLRKVAERDAAAILRSSDHDTTFGTVADQLSAGARGLLTGRFANTTNAPITDATPTLPTNSLKTLSIGPTGTGEPAKAAPESNGSSAAIRSPARARLSTFARSPGLAPGR